MIKCDSNPLQECTGQCKSWTNLCRIVCKSNVSYEKIWILGFHDTLADFEIEFAFNPHLSRVKLLYPLKSGRFSDNFKWYKNIPLGVMQIQLCSSSYFISNAFFLFLELPQSFKFLSLKQEPFSKQPRKRVSRVVVKPLNLLWFIYVTIED